MYAQNIHAEWTNLEDAKCVKYASWDDSNLFLTAWRTGTDEGRLETE